MEDISLKVLNLSLCPYCPTRCGGAVHESVVDEADDRPAGVASVDQPARLVEAGQGQG